MVLCHDFHSDAKVPETQGRRSSYFHSRAPGGEKGLSRNHIMMMSIVLLHIGTMEKRKRKPTHRGTQKKLTSAAEGYPGIRWLLFDVGFAASLQ